MKLCIYVKQSVRRFLYKTFEVERKWNGINSILTRKGFRTYLCFYTPKFLTKLFILVQQAFLGIQLLTMSPFVFFVPRGIPLCIHSKWFFKYFFNGNNFPHSLHLKSLSCLCFTAMWTRRSPLCAKYLPHAWHSKGFIPLWTIVYHILYKGMVRCFDVILHGF